MQVCKHTHTHTHTLARTRMHTFWHRFCILIHINTCMLSGTLAYTHQFGTNTQKRTLSGKYIHTICSIHIYIHTHTYTHTHTHTQRAHPRHSTGINTFNTYTYMNIRSSFPAQTDAYAHTEKHVNIYARTVLPKQTYMLVPRSH